jgi:hypothetical protein
MLDSQWLYLVFGEMPGLIDLGMIDALLASLPMVAGIGLALLAVAFALVWAAKYGLTRMD